MFSQAIRTKGRLSVFQNRSYLMYFIATTGSSLGTGMQYVANSWLALQLTGSDASVAIVLLCSTIPGIVLSPVIGGMVDRFDRKYLVACADSFRALVLTSIPILYHLGLLRPWQLYAMALLVAVGDQIYTPSAMAMVREIMPKDQLLNANVTTGVGNQIGALVGSGMSGLIISWFSPVAVMWVNAASFVFSAIFISLIRKGYVSPTITLTHGKSWSLLLKQVQEGVQYIRLNKSIISIYFIMLFLTMTIRTINTLLAPFAKDVLKVGTQGFGYIDASFALGSIAGGVLLPRIVRFIGQARTLVGGLFFISLSLGFLSVSYAVWFAMFAYFILGISFQVRVLLLTAAQKNTLLEYQGRVHATFNLFFSMASLLVYVVIGYLSEKLPLRWLYLFQGGLLFFVFFYVVWKFYRANKATIKATETVSSSFYMQ